MELGFIFLFMFFIVMSFWTKKKIYNFFAMPMIMISAISSESIYFIVAAVIIIFYLIFDVWKGDSDLV